jgi:nicotinate-nucleotide adenylyltransferase
MNTEELPAEHNARLAVFGGSFDPVHNGHTAIAAYVLDADLAEEVLFVPAGRPPHKTESVLAPPEDRLSMLRLVLDLEPRFAVSDIELLRTGRPSYTFDTLETLSRAFVGRRLIFVIGMDSLAELHLWRRATELVSRYPFLVYPRPGVEIPCFAALRERFGAKNARRLEAAVMTEAPISDVSSTEVRERCRAGLPLDGLVAPSVAAYIQAHSLYHGNDGGIQTPSP